MKEITTSEGDHQRGSSEGAARSATASPSASARRGSTDLQRRQQSPPIVAVATHTRRQRSPPEIRTDLFSVDSIPIRVFNNAMTKGVEFPTKQPMRIYSSLWNADDWATQGGRVKTDWTKAPFHAVYRGFRSRACIWSGGASSCASKAHASSAKVWMDRRLDAAGYRKLRWVQNKYMIYNYCTDSSKVKQGLPLECEVA